MQHEKYCREIRYPRLDPYDKDLSFCVLGNLTLLAAVFIGEIPLAEKQTMGHYERVVWKEGMD